MSASDRRGQAVLAVAGVALLASAAGCERLPTGPRAKVSSAVRGVTIAAWTADGYAGAAASASLDAIVSTGANTLVILVTGYQESAGSPQLRSADPRTPDTSNVRTLAAAAISRGMKVAIKMHVDLDDGSWRGRIAPSDPGAWFTSYRAFILPWAELARTSGAGQFVVGTELAGTLGSAPEWRSTIASVRAVFPGEVVYAASWDEAGRVSFWDAVDAVGVDAYFPVARRRAASRLEMLAAWQPWLDGLASLHRRTGRDVLLTEIGYRSVDGAGMAPFASGGNAAIDLGEQADLYWAALQATGSESWIRGLYWWDWPADGSGGPLDRSYSPAAKPAASVLAATWGGP